MQDSSPFLWLEDRGPACQLIALIDDATSKIWARFSEHDSTEENLRTLGGWLRRYGRPVAHYTDKNSIFRATRRAGIGEQLQGEGARSQFGRALKELGIEWIAAQSPQAKGRIERLFETLQDRLVKEMRLAGVATVEAANRFLEIHFLPEWERRFTVLRASQTHARGIADPAVVRQFANGRRSSYEYNRSLGAPIAAGPPNPTTSTVLPPNFSEPFRVPHPFAFKRVRATTSPNRPRQLVHPPSIPKRQVVS